MIKRGSTVFSRGSDHTVVTGSLYYFRGSRPSVVRHDQADRQAVTRRNTARGSAGREQKLALELPRFKANERDISKSHYCPAPYVER